MWQGELVIMPIIGFFTNGLSWDHMVCSGSYPYRSLITFPFHWKTIVWDLAWLEHLKSWEDLQQPWDCWLCLSLDFLPRNLYERFLSWYMMFCSCVWVLDQTWYTYLPKVQWMIFLYTHEIWVVCYGWILPTNSSFHNQLWNDVLDQSTPGNIKCSIKLQISNVIV